MLLRKDDPWDEALQVPDIRNWRVIDAEGRQVGFVESLFVVRGDKELQAIYTGANERYPASEIDVGDGIVQLGRSIDPEQPPVTSGAESRAATFGKSFRAHFESTYTVEDSTYDDFAPAYRFGRTMAADADFAGRSFSSAEEDLRAYYHSERHPRPFEEVREAIRFGFDLVHDIGRYHQSGLEREGKQILAPSGQNTEKSARTGTYMSTGRPPNEDTTGS